jgi:hypothetical protein
MEVDRVNDATIVREGEEIDVVVGPQLAGGLRLVEEGAPAGLSISVKGRPSCGSSFLNIALRVALRIEPLGRGRAAGRLSRRSFEIAGLGSQTFVFDSLAETREVCPP